MWLPALSHAWYSRASLHLDGAHFVQLLLRHVGVLIHELTFPALEILHLEEGDLDEGTEAKWPNSHQGVKSLKKEHVLMEKQFWERSYQPACLQGEKKAFPN